MNVNRFRQIEEIFHEAIARPAATRARFLREACDGDDDLQATMDANAIRLLRLEP